MRDTSGTAAALLGGMLVGFVGAFGLAGWVVISGHGILVALLAYSLGGMTLMLATLAGRAVYGAVGLRAARAARRPLRALVRA